MKNILVLIFSILFISFSIKSSYAEGTLKLIEINSTSNKTVELKFDKTINNYEELKSDLEIYRSLNNIAKKDENDSKKIILNLDSEIEGNTSYSLLSISGIEWNILFKLGNKISWEEIQNSDLVWENQWIKSILIKSSQIIELNFLENIDSPDLEFQLYKTIQVDKIKKSLDSENIKVLLKKELKNNSEYIGTLTYIETGELEKNQVEKGIYYFSTKVLKEYDPLLDVELLENNNIPENEKSLEDTLINALDDSKSLNYDKWELLDWENEIEEELKSSSDNKEDEEKTQLEKMALNQKETPDSGAETLVLIFGTFILSTLYFLSRRKKV